uniref:Polymerase (DNA directed), gamma 2, accessory subunit n=1 Tax=Cyprinodon variegatus TaxID=28743 RepID=A0A3Q2E824_CYPVA
MWIQSIRRCIRSHSCSGGTRGVCSPAADGSDRLRVLLQLCADRFYISPGESNAELFRRGWSCSYGPLGVELRGNLLRQWWHSVTGSKERVFGLSTPSGSAEQRAAGARLVEAEHVQQLLDRSDLNRDQLIQELRGLLLSSPSVRRSLLQGALENFVSSLEMVNRKLPFGLAEMGPCFHYSLKLISNGLGSFSQYPKIQVKIFRVQHTDFSSLTSLHFSQFRDGRKSVPHVVSVSGNIDRGVLAFLSNSLQQLRREDSKKRLQQRKVLKLHPVLAPVKVALDIGKGATVELRQVCEGLLQEFLEAKISAWPGYLETLPSSLEHLNAKYDEMGVLFSVVINENTLESGLLQVRSRDTTIRETMHISEIRHFLSKYITAADKL